MSESGNDPNEKAHHMTRQVPEEADGVLLKCHRHDHFLLEHPRGNDAALLEHDTNIS